MAVLMRLANAAWSRLVLRTQARRKATLEQDSADFITPRRPAITLPKLRWTQMLAISIFYLGLNFHWAALGIIILPGQVFKIVGDANKGVALAFVVVPGAFVSLFANPMFGLLSDRTRGRLATWGRRRPYILFGTLVNVAALIWMAASRDILSLTIAYAVVQFASNAAQAPFHALLPDIVPAEQRGLVSGVMGLLQTFGTIGGLIAAGLFIDTSQPFPIYQNGLWLAYGIIIVVLLTLMLITIIAVRERQGASAQLAAQEVQEIEANISHASLRPEGVRARPPRASASRIGANRIGASPIPTIYGWGLLVSDRIRRIPRSVVLNVVGTLFVVGVAWGMVTLWNTLHIAGLQIGGDVEQVILEIIATIGLLRLFDFNPRRDPDFAWVLLTRLVMMLGIYTIQTYLLYYMRDAVGAQHPEQQTTNFAVIVSLTSLLSAFVVGWLSDRFGRKRMVYLSGGFMALVGLIFIITQSLPIVLASGAIFGLGYGAYLSVDWALVADVLPSHKTYARDMGVWNISLSLPGVVAPVIGGPIIDSFTHAGRPVLGFQVLFAMAIVYCLLGTVTVRFIRGVKK